MGHSGVSNFRLGLHGKCRLIIRNISFCRKNELSTFVPDFPFGRSCLDLAADRFRREVIDDSYGPYISERKSGYGLRGPHIPGKKMNRVTADA